MGTLEIFFAVMTIIGFVGTYLVRRHDRKREAERKTR